MKFLLLLFVLVNLYNVSESRLSENLKVQIDDGLILGRYMETVSGRGIRSFVGIPYAAPPVGDLRFKGPKKPYPWKDNVLIAQNEPPMCTQTNVFDRGEKQDKGQEDCLYLNVYTPNINVSENAFKKLPVMVWFHGGGWMEFHSGHSVYGPGYLLDHDIILVTGNYRLGILGFLSTEDENCPGNFGFKDQHMILEWVHENIENFGGDKDSVTIFGESAGGAIVNLLMNSPKSRNLFHRAISQSGSMMNVWSEPHPTGLAKERATKLAVMMECPTDSTKDMIECLRKVPASKITAAIRNFMVWDYDPVIPFGAVVERTGLREDCFIVDSVIDKESFDIPWMTGVTSEEMLFKAAGILNSKKLSNDIQEKWEIIFPATFNYDHLSEQNIKEINAAIYDYYHKDEGLLGENLVTMWSDGWFVNGFIDYLQQRLSSNRHANTFVYLFSHKGSISFSEVFGSGPDKFVGTSHLDDLLYLFPMRNTFPQFFNSIPTEEDENLRKIMTKLWVDFATNGTPTPDLGEVFAWTPATKFPLDYMRIGNKNGNSDKLLEMEKDLFSKNAQFWINLREKYGLRLWKNADEKKIKSEL